MFLNSDFQLPFHTKILFSSCVFHYLYFYYIPLYGWKSLSFFFPHIYFDNTVLFLNLLYVNKYVYLSLNSSPVDVNILLHLSSPLSFALYNMFFSLHFPYSGYLVFFLPLYFCWCFSIVFST